MRAAATATKRGAPPREGALRLRTVRPPEAQRHVEFLLKKGMTMEEIAYRTRVSLNSVVRWRKGAQPQPGHLFALRDLVKSVNRGALPT